MGLFDGIFGGKNGVAKTLLNVFGTPAVISIQGTSVYDPETGTATQEEDAEYPVNISPPQGYKLSDIDGSSVLKGDMSTSIAACELSTIPLPDKSSLIFSGEKWRIVNVEPVYTGAIAALYVLQLRKA